MTWTWTKESPARWDEDKRHIFGADELASVGMSAPAADAPLADEWWTVTDDDGTAVDPRRGRADQRRQPPAARPSSPTEKRGWSPGAPARGVRCPSSGASMR